MSSMNLFVSRKRHYSPAFRDDSDSDSDLPPKRRKNEDLPITLKSKLLKIAVWVSDLKNLSKFMKMALRSGATLPNRIPNENDAHSEEEDSDEDDDISIQEIQENIEGEVSPLTKKFEISHISKDSGHSMWQVTANGSCSIGSHCSPHKLNGSSSRDWLAGYHGSRNCRLKRTEIDNLKRQPVISNPATEIEILLGSQPEAVAIESDGIEILSELPSSKQKHTSSPKPYRNSLKSSSAKNSTSSIKSRLSSVKKPCSSLSKSSYTANEVVRLQEKAQYKLLLEKYINGSHYHHVSRSSQSDASVQADTSIFSNNHFKKEVLQQPIDSFIEKYYTPCRLLPPKDKESSEMKKEPPEIVVVDDGGDDDDVQILDIKMPEYKAKYKARYFTRKWITELRENLRNQTEERNKIVEEHEHKLEIFKKERLLNRLRIDIPVGTAVEPEFPELTAEMLDIIDQVINTGAPEDQICKISSDYLLRKDFETLSGFKWLNDSIINAYFDLIVERSKQEGYPSIYAYNTFFYSTYKTKGYSSVRRWTRKIDIFSFDLNFVPLHVSVHWCLAVIDHRSKKICYYDSMGTSEDICNELLHDYLCMEYKDKKGEILEPSTYTTKIMGNSVPQQMNGSDCGMFTLKYAECISRDAEITFNQRQMNHFRKIMIYELLTNQLL